MNYFPDYSLTEKEKGKKVSVSTLQQFQKAVRFPDVESMAILNFFQKNKINIIRKYLPSYQHYLVQYSLPFFMKKKDIEIVAEAWYEHGSNGGMCAAKKQKIEIGKNEYIDGYSNGMIFFANKDDYEKDRAIITIDIGPNNGYYYDIYTLKDSNLWQELFDYSKKNNFYKGAKIDANCSFLEMNVDVSWDDIVLPDRTKRVIKNNVENLFKHKQILKKNNISLKRGIILSGPPGTGKTLICKVLANELPVTVLYVLPSHITRKSDINRICDMALDLSPTLLILEDIDYIAQDREEVNSWAVIDLMNRLDGLEEFEEVITIATTNLVEKVEDAIKNRPGRFDRVINIPNPDLKHRKYMLHKFTKDFILDQTVNFDYLASKTDNMSGAYIKDLCKTAALLAILNGDVNPDGIAILSMEYLINAYNEIKNKDFKALGNLEDRRPIGFAPSMTVTEGSPFPVKNI